uniref:Uncharacterized protein n=1 Tax=Picea glauca TaxID=3330 RepID=A0A101M086_PICGL|nr:hypothetical protein ABT39_MTgene4493 [Picea glauca]QHR87401.1 hypothetical protein Q903MT_gene1411 [Picea sitchensis]
MHPTNKPAMHPTELLTSPPLRPSSIFKVGPGPPIPGISTDPVVLFLSFIYTCIALLHVSLLQSALPI